VGQFRHTQQILNIQPVVPVALGSQTLIVRVIQSFIAQPQLTNMTGSMIGIGDMNPQLFYVPKQGATIIGYGAAMVFPTATSVAMGQGKWSLGPNGIIVVTRPTTLYGLLANNVWSITGDRSRPNVNQMLLQPFYNWTLPYGLTLGLQSQSTVNWERPEIKSGRYRSAQPSRRLFSSDRARAKSAERFFRTLCTRISPETGQHAWYLRF
jgi:hypothetical protein